MCRNRALAGEEGQALVELSLSCSLLFLILLGAIEFARATFVAIEVENSARAGAQYAAMNGGNESDTAGVTTAIQNDSFNLGGSVALDSGFPTQTNACSDGSTYSATSYCNGATIFSTVSVKTKMTFSPLIGWPGLPTSFTFYGFAQEMVLQ
ncbi:MAG TPA: TadE/TadG family type IV pilus assembly protein [Terracidiphilus sp.]|nr:TadE/TadG family type IV pilus assembly protein [Terracidiphilus sp.]